MRVLVYPHSMEIGGSQLNAVELAGAVRDRGHDVVVYSEQGPLCAAVERLGLEAVAREPSRISPGPATARHLGQVVRDRRIDVVHGYEWPPILEGYAATAPFASGAVTVGTVMSMAVAPFLPRGLPLFVGTERLRAATAPRRPGPVVLMEPPVDTAWNRPGVAGRPLPRGADGVAQVVVVSRLVEELKLEGILTAVRAVGVLARRRGVRLVVVGDGACRGRVEEAARLANEGLERPAVVLTGSLADPRAAYDAADICLGMGGSALRALAFAKPLVVQGERGFFETLTPASVPCFLEQGWYGVGSRSPDEAVVHLVRLLEELLDAPDRRTELGRFGRRLVEERFSLARAAELAEEVYVADRERREALRWARDGTRAGVGLVAHKVRRRWQQVRGRRPRDDFNARPA